MPVLYQKYRPQKFSEVVGQSHVVKTLQNALMGGQTSHAYLFCGSRGTGKTTLARILAKAVNCQNPQAGDVCGECENCLDFARGRFLDVVEIDAASYTGVDNVREIIEQARSLPTRGTMRVYIIDEVHMLSKAAFNALLKTLEEPPAHVLFILATTEVSKVPTTVLSRVQRFDFLLHGREDILSNLQMVAKTEGIGLPQEVFSLIINASGGGMRDALTLLDHVVALGKGADADLIRRSLGLADRNATLQLLEVIVSGRSQDLQIQFFDMEAAAVDFKALSEDCLEVLRTALQHKLSEQMLGEELSMFARLSVQDLVYLIRLILRAYKEYARSPDPSLPLFLASAESALKFVGNSNQQPVLTLDEQSTSRLLSGDSPMRLGDKPASPFNHHTGENYKTEDKPIVILNPRVVIANEPVFSVKEDYIAIDVDSARLLWPQICLAISDMNTSLGSLLKQARIEKVESANLVLSVKYDFHRKKLEQAKYMEMLKGVLFKKGIKTTLISVVVDKELEVGGGDTFVAAMRILGEEVVE